MSPAQMKQLPDSPGVKWIALLLNLLVVPIFAALLLHDRNLASINANRFTAEDGAKIWQALAALPPDSFELKVDTLIQSVNDLKVDVARIDATIQRMETK